MDGWYAFFRTWPAIAFFFFLKKEQVTYSELHCVKRPERKEDRVQS